MIFFFTIVLLRLVVSLYCSSWSAYSISKFLVFFKVLWNLLTFLSKMSHRTCPGIIFRLSLALVVNGSRKEKFASGLLQQFLAYIKATQFHLRFLLVVSAWLGIQLALVSNLINLCNSSFLSSFFISFLLFYQANIRDTRKQWRY